MLYPKGVIPSAKGRRLGAKPVDQGPENTSGTGVLSRRMCVREAVRRANPGVHERESGRATSAQSGGQSSKHGCSHAVLRSTPRPKSDRILPRGVVVLHTGDLGGVLRFRGQWSPLLALTRDRRNSSYAIQLPKLSFDSSLRGLLAAENTVFGFGTKPQNTAVSVLGSTATLTPSLETRVIGGQDVVWVRG